MASLVQTGGVCYGSTVQTRTLIQSILMDYNKLMQLSSVMTNKLTEYTTRMSNLEARNTSLRNRLLVQEVQLSEVVPGLQNICSAPGLDQLPSLAKRVHELELNVSYHVGKQLPPGSNRVEVPRPPVFVPPTVVPEVPLVSTTPIEEDFLPSAHSFPSPVPTSNRGGAPTPGGPQVHNPPRRAPVVVPSMTTGPIPPTPTPSDFLPQEDSETNPQGWLGEWEGGEGEEHVAGDRTPINPLTGSPVSSPKRTVGVGGGGASPFVAPVAPATSPLVAGAPWDLQGHV